MPEKNCPYCNGTGVMYVQNGPDDVDAEPCYCIEYEDTNLSAEEADEDDNEDINLK